MAQTMTTKFTLMRARKGRMIGGVAAGLAQTSGMDVTLVRLCFGATMLFGGIGVPAYILMWIVLPDEAPKRGIVIERAPEQTARAIRFGLVGIAALTMLNEVGGFFTFGGPRGDGFGLDGVIGLILVGIGVSVLFSRHRPDRTWWEPTETPMKSKPSVHQPTPAGDDPSFRNDVDEDPPTFAGPFSEVIGTVHNAVSDAMKEAATTFRESRPSRPQGPEQGTPEYVDEFIDNGYIDYEDFETEPTGTTTTTTTQTRPPRLVTVTAPGGDSAGGFALGLARFVGWTVVIWWTLGAIALTALWVFGALTIEAPVVLMVAGWVTFIGVVNTLLHARFARAIVPTLALLLIPMGIAAGTVRTVGEAGHVVANPEEVTEDQSYRLTLGQLDLDYGSTEFTKTRTVVNGRVGAGAIFVTVPNDAELIVNARSQVGDHKILGSEQHEMSPNEKITSKGCGEGSPTIELNLRTGAGYIEVQRANGEREATCKKAA